ncbi:hypothetical protein [Phenylobacterium sp.]|uniref:hypothetical protein n=1 Tax=Phenylobacterium sp. TaxID=1871053 RepID=UPI002F423A51
MSGSYARGGQPRSVPDPDAAAYEAMVRKQRALNSKHDAHEALPKPDYWSTHPGLGESLIPVWGSAREAIADAKEGDIAGAAINGLLAASDLAPGAALVKTAGKGIIKGGMKLSGSNTWRATRRWMANRGMIEKGVHGHHAIIPRGGIGKAVPDKIKNQPWNITGLDAETHGRIHGSYNGSPQFSPWDRYWTGTPPWAKSAQKLALNRSITVTDSQTEK